MVSVGGARLRQVKALRWALPLLLSAGWLSSSGASAQTLRVAQAFEYTQGSYGARLDTETFIAATSLRYTDDGWTFGLTIPYVRVKGPGAPFAPFAISAFAIRPPSELSGAVIPLLSLPNDASFFFPQFSLTSEGIGDVTASVARSFELKRDRLFLDVTGVLKLPTGDPDALIGTGEPDITGRGDFVYEANGYGLFAGGGYAVTGRSDRFDLQNRWQISAGAYVPIGRRFTAGALYDWRQSIVADSTDISEVTTYVSLQLDQRFSILGYALAGLSDASPDFGFGVRLAVDFDVRSLRASD